MNKYLPGSIIVLACVFASHKSSSQTTLVADQNPDFAISQARYMKIADSVNSWHSTTLHETYKAVDWLEDRKEARAERREFRRQMALQRQRWGGYYYPDYNYRHNYRQGRYTNYNYRHRHGRHNHSIWNLWCW